MMSLYNRVLHDILIHIIKQQEENGQIRSRRFGENIPEKFNVICKFKVIIYFQDIFGVGINEVKVKLYSHPSTLDAMIHVK